MQLQARLASVIILCACCGSSLAQTADNPPPGFEVTTYATGLVEPTSIAFAPDGTLFVAERGGKLRIVRNGALLADPAAQLEVFTSGEGGLLGLAVDPDFAESGDLFAFASVSAVEQQVLRLRIEDDRAVEISVLRGNLPTAGGNHNGGAIDVGPDGMIYFAIGDTGTPELSQEVTSLAGKVARIDRDGTTPEDNPFSTPTGTPRAAWATGFRNPFRMCFAPDGRLFVADVGSSDDRRREEINLVQPGSDHGWPLAEGKASDLESLSPAYLDPLLAYADEGASVSGCAVYTGAVFPEEYRGDLFHLDFTSHGLFRVVLDGDTVVSHTLFAPAANGPVDLIQGPDGALYWVELFSGEVRRLSYPAGEPDVDVPPSDDPDDHEPSDNDPANDPSDGTQDDPSDGLLDHPSDGSPDNPPDGIARLPMCGSGLVAALWPIAGCLALASFRPTAGYLTLACFTPLPDTSPVPAPPRRPGASSGRPCAPWSDCFPPPRP